MDLSTKSTEDDEGEHESKGKIAEMMSDDELKKVSMLEANTSLLNNLISMKQLNDKALADVKSDVIVNNLLYLAEVRQNRLLEDGESREERTIRKSRQRCRRYRERLKERIQQGLAVANTKSPKSSGSASGTAPEFEEIEGESRADRKKRFSRERSRRYRQRLKDKEEDVVQTQHNVILGNIVIGRVEMEETVAEKRRRKARERYRRGRGERIHTKKKKRIKEEMDYSMDEEIVYHSAEEDTAKEAEIKLEKEETTPLSMQDYLHRYSLSVSSNQSELVPTGD